MKPYVDAVVAATGCEVDPSFPPVARRGTMTFRANCSGQSVAVKIATFGKAGAGLGFTPASRLQHETVLLSDLRQKEGPWPALVQAGAASAPALLEPECVYQMATWIEGQSIRDLLRPHRSDKESLRPLFSRVAINTFRAVAGLHAHGLLHGDLQPQHFLFGCDSGRSVVIDFGHARRSGETDGHKYRGGMVHFVAPEIAKDILAKGFGEQSVKADLFSTASALFSTINGVLLPSYPKEFRPDAPWIELLKIVAACEFKSFELYADRIDRNVLEILQACVMADPQSRPDSANQVLEMLGAPPAPDLAIISDRA